MTLVAVLAVVAGATGAFFQDTETSEGNIFVAGALDLQIDAGGAYYNGHECDNGTWTCEPWADHVVDFEQGTQKNGSPVKADRSNPSAALGPAETNGDASDSGFSEDEFASLGFGYNLGFGGRITLKFDNLILNGPGDDLGVREVTGGSYPDELALVEVSQDGSNWLSLGTANRDEEFNLDSVGLDWARYVRVSDVSNEVPFPSNADGYDLDGAYAIHCGADPDEQALSGQSCDGSWDLTDLTNETFFNFDDVKPSDFGKNVISFHLDDNPGWVCLIPHDLEDEENDRVDPEVEDGDTTDGPLNGELSKEIEALAWMDNDGDGYFEPNLGEMLLHNGSFFDLFDTNLAVTDSLTGDPLTPTTTKWVGLVWCAGDLDVDLDWGLVSCDGSGMSNVAQTDSLVASLSAYAEQSRNNSSFQCSGVNLEGTTPTPKVGADLAAYSAPSCDVTVDNVNDLVNEVDSATQGKTICVADGDYDLSSPLVMDTEGVTLASVNGPLNTATITGGIFVDASNVTITGLVFDGFDYMGSSENAAIYVHNEAGQGSGNSLTGLEVSYNIFDAPTGAAGNPTTVNGGLGSNAIISEIANSATPQFSNSLITHNRFDGWHRGVFLNPSSGIVISYNDFYNNFVGSGNDGPGSNSVHHNDFEGNTNEALGVSDADNGTGNDNILLVNINNIADGAVNNWGSVVLNAENNWWGGNGAGDQIEQAGGGTVDADPETPSAYDEN